MAPINQNKMIISMCDSDVFARMRALSLACNLINDGEDRFTANCHGAARSSQKSVP
jgi:hypothetical protein